MNTIPLTYWTVFLVTCWGGSLLMIATSGIFRQTMLLPILILPVLQHLRIKLNSHFHWLSILFCTIILVSAFLNDTSLIPTLSLLRWGIVAYLVTFACRMFVKGRRDTDGIFTFLFRLAQIQLIVIALQFLLYPYLPPSLKAGRLVAVQPLVDFLSGTFESDAESSLLMTIMVLLLLFRLPVVNHVVKYPFMNALFLTGGIFFSNSQICHLLVLIAWGSWLLFRFRVELLWGSRLLFRFRVGIVIAICVIIIAIPFVYSAAQTQTSGEINVYGINDTIYKTMVKLQQAERRAILVADGIGGHERTAAVYYYVFLAPVKWIGDGPGSIWNTANAGSFANTVAAGHNLVLYPEIGLLGLTVSWLLVASLIFIEAPNRFRGKLFVVRLIMLMMMFGFMFFQFVLNRIGVMLFLATISYCLDSWNQETTEVISYEGY
ncbi:MAG: hypothetical protein AAF639_36120 [Chloroflexota bacterium]